MKQLILLDVPKKRPASTFVFNPKEFKIQCMRECPTPAEMQLCDTPQRAADYWRSHVVEHPYYSEDVETFAVLLLNTRRKTLGHHLVSTGTLDTVLITPRETFRAAIIANAAAVVLAHCHPSGDPSPSEADIKVTRDLIRAGQLLKIEVLDHIIVGRPSPENQKGYASLRELGFFYA